MSASVPTLIGPPIAPVPPGVARPHWSVMIPTFNCARFLGQTIASVIAQASPPAEMEIVVVDDVSTRDDPEEVVRQVGGGRVRFSRNEANLGATRNFNHCIELAQGELVHILHGDDYVEPGFYAEISRLERENPNCAFYATRTIAVEEDGTWSWISPRVPALETGSHNVSECVNDLYFQTPSVVVRRRLYEETGGFDIALAHVADWEMWVRSIRVGGGAVSKKPLAYYRMFASNDSGRLAQTGANVRDEMQLLTRFAHLPGFEPKRFRRARAATALSQAQRFKKLGNPAAERANWQIYTELRDFRSLIRDVVTSWLRGP